MTGKEMYKIWASDMHGRWARFAKPALFVRAEGKLPVHESMGKMDVPTGVAKLIGPATAIIVDLPGRDSVKGGIALAKEGYRPVPMYNGIHESNIGGQRQIVNNGPILDALAAGTGELQNASIRYDAPPVFLLDNNRNKPVADTTNMYDNRWELELDDMPSADFMVTAGIQNIVLWTAGARKNDLAAILDSYRDMGINVTMHISPTPEEKTATAIANSVRISRQPNVRKFENARVGLLLIAGMAVINLIFMFLIHEEPVLWTTPTIMWLTYLWLIEIAADIIAVAFVAAYIILYFGSARQRAFLPLALGLFVVEALVFFIYVGYYGGPATFAGHSFWYGVFAFGFPLICLPLIASGAFAYSKLKDVTDWEYLELLDDLDKDFSDDEMVFGRGRRHFRGFRGYGGYGGSGHGGYRGGGYRGYGGGYGGFGG